MMPANSQGAEHGANTPAFGREAAILIHFHTE